MSNDAERLKRYAQSRKEKRHVRPVAQNILTDNDNHTVIYQNDNNGAELVLPGDVGTDETFGIIGFAQNA